MIGLFQYTCKSCISGSGILTARLIEIDKRVGQVEKQALENSVEITKVREEAIKTSKRVDTLEKNMDSTVETTKESVFAEMNERENRKLNLIFHGIPEPSLDLRTGEEKKEADLQQVDKVLKAIKVPTQPDIKFCTRLGKLNPNIPSQTRPVLIGMQDLETKKLILAAARNLKGTEFEKVGIVPDLTKQQRQQEANLWKEAETRNQDMSQEESLNFQWRPTGPKGQQVLSRVRKRPGEPVKPQENRRKRNRLEMETINVVPEEEEEGIQNLEDGEEETEPPRSVMRIN